MVSRLGYWGTRVASRLDIWRIRVVSWLDWVRVVSTLENTCGL